MLKVHRFKLCTEDSIAVYYTHSDEAVEIAPMEQIDRAYSEHEDSNGKAWHLLEILRGAPAKILVK